MGSWRRRFTFCRGAVFFRSTPWAKPAPTTTGGRLSSRKLNLEKVWRDFFLDPSEWWDHRTEKANPKYPDFKHKKTQQSLWLNNNLTPPWVEGELAAIAPGTLHSNIFSWNVKLRRYIKAGDYQRGIVLFQQMQQEGIIPDKFTFVRVLNACSGLLALEEGKRIHLQIIESGLESDLCVGTCLVDMYAKCGRIEDAQRVFNKISTRDSIAWSTLIMGYVRCGQGQGALKIFRLMQRKGLELLPETFVGVLNACARTGALEEGRYAHVLIIDKGYERDLHVSNSLIDMYAKCGNIADAQRVFIKMPIRDVVSWSTLILGYVKCGEGHEALRLSRLMQQEGVDLDPVTFVGVLNACASIGALEEGRRAHEQINRQGYESNAFVANSLVDMYAKCGSIEDARRVFNKMPTRDTVSWGALILGYVKCGQAREALELSQKMQREGVDLIPVTFIGVLSACASTGALEEGRLAHKQIIERGYNDDVYVASSLVDMYAKCGSIQDAQRVFNEMHTKDMVCWGALVLGYVKCGQGQEALEVFQQMQHEGVHISPVTFVGVLNACATIGALEEGRLAHGQIIGRGYEYNAHVASSLIDMYAKCGSIEDAQRVFDGMPVRDIVSWSAMLAGYCRYGYAKETLEHFERMCEDVEVDAVSFLSLLSACSHGGFVDEGSHYFASMVAVFNISPTLEHYACVSDLLGRAGRLHEAEDLISRMPCEPDALIWMSLLGACRIHGNVGMAESVSNQVLFLDPENASRHVLLSNTYAAAGKWDKVQDVHCGRLERDENLPPGRAWIEVNKKVHSFQGNDSNHLQIREIHGELERLSLEMR